jgi:hypothetical protein
VRAVSDAQQEPFDAQRSLASCRYDYDRSPLWRRRRIGASVRLASVAVDDAKARLEVTALEADPYLADIERAPGSR